MNWTLRFQFKSSGFVFEFCLSTFAWKIVLDCLCLRPWKTEGTMWDFPLSVLSMKASKIAKFTTKSSKTLLKENALTSCMTNCIENVMTLRSLKHQLYSQHSFADPCHPLNIFEVMNDLSKYWYDSATSTQPFSSSQFKADPKWQARQGKCKFH